ncbi:MAG: hypothetical protein J5589_11780 [Firmicutes bacterium]|nr:hypothetical protein [Bacillota bacterium]
MSSTNKTAAFKEYMASRNGKILLFLILIFLLVLAGALPKTIREIQAKQFAKPLFKHAVPENTRIIQTYAEKTTETGSTFATIILQSPMTDQELLSFYSDIEYPPAGKNEQVSLQVLPCPEDHVTVLKNNGLYQEDAGECWYIYLYSAPAEE